MRKATSAPKPRVEVVKASPNLEPEDCRVPAAGRFAVAFADFSATGESGLASSELLSCATASGGRSVKSTTASGRKCRRRAHRFAFELHWSEQLGLGRSRRDLQTCMVCRRHSVLLPALTRNLRRGLHARIHSRARQCRCSRCIAAKKRLSFFLG